MEDSLVIEVGGAEVRRVPMCFLEKVSSSIGLKRTELQSVAWRVSNQKSYSCIAKATISIVKEYGTLLECYTILTGRTGHNECQITFKLT